MPLYAHYGVRYAWLIDPVAHTLEVYQLESGAWVEVDRFADADRVAAPPFEAVSIDLEGLWLSQPRLSDPHCFCDLPGTEFRYPALKGRDIPAQGRALGREVGER